MHAGKSKEGICLICGVPQANPTILSVVKELYDLLVKMLKDLLLLEFGDAKRVIFLNLFCIFSGATTGLIQDSELLALVFSCADTEEPMFLFKLNPFGSACVLGRNLSRFLSFSGLKQNGSRK